MIPLQPFTAVQFITNNIDDLLQATFSLTTYHGSYSLCHWLQLSDWLPTLEVTFNASDEEQVRRVGGLTVTRWLAMSFIHCSELDAALIRFLLLCGTPTNAGRIILQAYEQLRLVGVVYSQAARSNKLEWKPWANNTNAVLDMLRSGLRFKNYAYFVRLS